MNKVFAVLLATFALTTSFHTNDLGGRNSETKSLVKNKSAAAVSANASSDELYTAIDFSAINRLNPEVFKKALTGFNKLKDAGKLGENSHILSICDFSLSSTEKRLWIIDLDARKVLYNSLVAHGKNTGEQFAKNFSNSENSLESSLGFYVTEGTYQGGNGYSLRLEGMDKGFNDNALARAIVMHGADYVSEQFARAQNRIGRSWGCPAVPRELAESIINTVKNKNCLFIYYPDEQYLNSSEWLKA